ncbi:D-sedoheptulose-7-phosphate isomerase [Clostridium butyricum]|uniref:D-sedoheptulose-7-phosphate isomerase n=1 Tax=Clostridium butyricum TaxID=1492 RepID=UPI0013CFDD7F|nr:SIS domain-containing protein [Clostridium butyricum]MCQ2022956.1 SIS domain-containing protein [Clostridium butyricum]NFB70098.1 SIS domain-containing protein [Clostridium butyricum]NFB89885.1 SIS domain-containing protein [Clostridium butyricum]
MRKFIQVYVAEVKDLLQNLNQLEVEKVIESIIDAYKNKKQIFIMGNGGSASTASHFACDLGKGTIIEGKKRFKVMSLNDNMALITAFSNDYGYEHVFSEQLKNLVNKNDIVIAISASGNSSNIVKGIEYAKEKDAKVIAFSGFLGGKLRELADECIHIDCDNYGQIEDLHMVLCHLISQSVKSIIANE